MRSHRVERSGERVQKYRALVGVAAVCVAIGGQACGADVLPGTAKSTPDAGAPPASVELQERAQAAGEAVRSAAEDLSGGLSDATDLARERVDGTVDSARAGSAELERSARAATAEAIAAAARAREEAAAEARALEADARAAGI